MNYKKNKNQLTISQTGLELLIFIAHNSRKRVNGSRYSSLNSWQCLTIEFKLFIIGTKISMSIVEPWFWHCLSMVSIKKKERKYFNFIFIYRITIVTVGFVMIVVCSMVPITLNPHITSFIMHNSPIEALHEGM